VRHKPRNPEINVTPLVDVVLVLLIIFMVVIPQLDSGAPVDMPSVVNVDEKGDVDYEPLVISVTSKGTLYFEKQPVERKDLVTLLTQAHAAQPDRKLNIKGDKHVSYSVVRDVFADCQNIGFPGVGLEVGERAQEEEES
jgi:biopolymer transport protein ExbD